MLSKDTAGLPVRSATAMASHSHTNSNSIPIGAEKSSSQAILEELSYH
jgi:hypothetical protein